jgi:hypothetical protein
MAGGGGGGEWPSYRINFMELLERMPVVQLLKNFPAFYGTKRLITVFTRAHRWSLF